MVEELFPEPDYIVVTETGDAYGIITLQSAKRWMVIDYAKRETSAIQNLLGKTGTNPVPIDKVNNIGDFINNCIEWKVGKLRKVTTRVLKIYQPAL